MFGENEPVYAANTYPTHKVIRRLGELEDILFGSIHNETGMTIKRLRELAQAEFQGMNVILKVKPGGVIYLLLRMSTGAVVEAVRVMSVTMGERGLTYLCKDSKGKKFEVWDSMQGEIMFYTLEEAEQARREHDESRTVSRMAMEEVERE